MKFQSQALLTKECKKEEKEIAFLPYMCLGGDVLYPKFSSENFICYDVKLRPFTIILFLFSGIREKFVWILIFIANLFYSPLKQICTWEYDLNKASLTRP